jgi:predicted site-specific integrase-resolvase
MFTPHEIAALLKVEYKTVLGWLRDPRHPLVGIKVNHMWRVRESVLKNYLEGKHEEA